MNDTRSNLETAFAGESQANRKYLAFGTKAEKDGFPQVAKLFRAAAAAETVHAHAHLRPSGGVKTTEENFAEAVAGEAYEFQTMYPEFIATAEAEDQKRALVSFRNANAVEKIHHDLYEKALAAVKSGADVAAEKVWVCDICGNAVYGAAAPEVCPICGAVHTRFFEVE